MAVLEVGSGSVRVLSGGGGPGAGLELDPALVQAALDWVDDPVGLYRDRPVRVAELWRAIMLSAVGERCDRLVVVHSDGWPPYRVHRVLAAANAVAEDVVAVRRSAWPPPGRTAEQVAHRPARVRRRAVPVAVGAIGSVLAITVCALSIRTAVAGRVGPVRVSAAGADQARTEAPRTEVPRTEVPRTEVPRTEVPRTEVPRTEAPRTEAPRTEAPRTEAPRTEVPRTEVPRTVVEGRVAVEVPGDWAVTRVAAGPGSRRLQVTSPADPAIALHITQAYAPEATLAQAAELFARAIAGRPEFVGLRPDARVAGRPALVYREVRPGRFIDWAVVMTGATRISVGCQSRPGDEQAVRAACRAAVSSAREAGTDFRR